MLSRRNFPHRDSPGPKSSRNGPHPDPAKRVLGKLHAISACVIDPRSRGLLQLCRVYHYIWTNVGEFDVIFPWYVHLGNASCDMRSYAAFHVLRALWSLPWMPDALPAVLEVCVQRSIGCETDKHSHHRQHCKVVDAASVPRCNSDSAASTLLACVCSFYGFPL